MKLKCPFCKSGRHKTQGDGCANCLRCEKTYYFELTPAGKRYRYFSDEGMNEPIKLKDADLTEFQQEDKIPHGMALYGCKHPITRQYVEIIAKDRLDAMTKLGWEETPGRTTWCMPIKVGKELKPKKEEFEVLSNNPDAKSPTIKQKKEKPMPKKKREGPTLKQQILGQHVSNKEEFLEGTYIILRDRVEAEEPPRAIDMDHLKKRAKLYFSMYRKELGL